MALYHITMRLKQSKILFGSTTEATTLAQAIVKRFTSICEQTVLAGQLALVHQCCNKAPRILAKVSFVLADTRVGECYGDRKGAFGGEGLMVACKVQEGVGTAKFSSAIYYPPSQALWHYTRLSRFEPDTQ